MDGFTVLLVGVIVGLVVGISTLGSRNVQVDIHRDYENHQPVGCAPFVWLVIFGFIIIAALASGESVQSSVWP